MPEAQDIIELCKLEHTALRRELNQLKWCQVQFFTFAITATIVVLGLIFKSGSDLDLHTLENNAICLVSLIPLLFLIPSLWIFLDTAKTTSRIVGYHFWIESIILGRIDPAAIRFVGWETALSVMRENALLLEREEREGDETAAFSAIHEELAPYNRNFLRLGKSNMAVFGSIRGYLVAVYVTFAVFIGLCAFPFTYYAYRTGTAIIAQGSLFNSLGIAVVLFSFFVVGWEFATLKHLIYGKFSDAANRIKWKIVFEGSDRVRDRFGLE